MSTTVVGDIVYNLDVNTSKFMQGMNDANSRLGGLGGSMEKTDAQANRLTSSMSKLGIAIGAAISIQGMKVLTEASEKFTLLQARIDRLSTSAEDGAQSYNKLLKVANSTGSDLRTTVQVWESLTGSLKEMGKTNDEIIEVTELLQKMGTLGGSSAEEMKNGLRQLGQSFAGGIVRGEEFNSVLENTPEIARQLAKGLGVPFGELRQMMLDSKLTSEAVFTALQKRAETVNKEFANMPRTIAQATEAMNNNFGTALSRLDKEIGFSQSIVKAMDMATKAVGSFMNSVDGVAQVVEYGKLAVESIAAVLVGKYVTAMASSAVSTYQMVMASRAATAAAIEQASAEVRKAEVVAVGAKANLERATAAIAAAKAELDASRATQAAEVERLKSVQAALVAERNLEAQRLKAQITDKGRAASVARMAELQTANVAITNQLAAAEATLQRTTVASSTSIAAAYEARAVAAGEAAAATNALNAATAAAGRAAQTTSVLMRGLSAVMNTLGGPLGVIMLAATALYYFADAARATKVDVDQLKGSLERMTFAQLSKASNDAADDIAKLNKKLSNAMQELNTATRRPFEDESDFKKRKTALQAEQDEIKGQIQARKDLQAQIAAQQKTITDSQMNAGNPSAPAPRKMNADDAKVLDNLQKERELAKLVGEERARQAAIQKLSSDALPEEKQRVGDLAVEIYRLNEAKKETVKTDKEGETAAKRKSAAEKKGAEENAKAITDYAIEIAKLADKTQQYSEAAALAKLNKFATPEDVRVMKELAAVQDRIIQAEKNKELLGSVDPVQGENNRYEKEISDLKTANDLKLLENDRYLELKNAAEVAHQQTLANMEVERFRSMNATNEAIMSSIEALGAAGTNALSGLASGTMSLTAATGQLANTVLNALIGSYVQSGVEFVKQEIAKRAATKATEAAQVAGIGTVAATQTGATAAIASTTTTTAAATGAEVATSMAPAAGLSSIASFGGAAIIGGSALLATMLLAKSFGGGRQYGGAVNSDSIYRINERGPEIFTDNSGKQYMTGASGKVTSHADAFGGGQGSRGIQVIIENYGGQEVTASQQQLTDRDVIRIVVGNIAEGGQIGRAVNNVTGTKRQGE